MPSYSESLVTTNAIAEDIHRYRHSLESAYALISQTYQLLNDMESKYAGFVAEVNQKDPNDPEWAAMSGKVNKLVDDFVLLKTYAESVKNAVEAVE